MARLLGGLGSPHAPSIGAAIDRGETQTPDWKPLFDGFGPMRDWLEDKRPDVLVVVYNDHFTSLFLDNLPTFALSVASEHRIADEGWGPRPLPPVPGDAELAWHLAHALVADEFDLSVSHDLPLDHGCLTPLSALWDWNPGWPGRVVPLQVNVLQFPLPTPRRCYRLGQALRRAIESYPEDIGVAVLGTGGLSHQLGGERFGFINPDWDREFLARIETDPESLAALTHAELIERGGTEGVEEIMWLVMRGALAPAVRCVHRNYHHATLTGYGQIILEDA
jgi:protocatechuate 4,5-dioxygenase beta chain